MLLFFLAAAHALLDGGGGGGGGGGGKEKQHALDKEALFFFFLNSFFPHFSAVLFAKMKCATFFSLFFSLSLWEGCLNTRSRFMPARKGQGGASKKK